MDCERLDHTYCRILKEGEDLMKNGKLKVWSIEKQSSSGGDHQYVTGRPEKENDGTITVVNINSAKKKAVKKRGPQSKSKRKGAAAVAVEAPLAPAGELSAPSQEATMKPAKRKVGRPKKQDDSVPAKKARKQSNAARINNQCVISEVDKVPSAQKKNAARGESATEVKITAAKTSVKKTIAKVAKKDKLPPSKKSASKAHGKKSPAKTAAAKRVSAKKIAPKSTASKKAGGKEASTVTQKNDHSKKKSESNKKQTRARPVKKIAQKKTRKQRNETIASNNHVGVAAAKIDLSNILHGSRNRRNSRKL